MKRKGTVLVTLVLLLTLWISACGQPSGENTKTPVPTMEPEDTQETDVNNTPGDVPETVETPAVEEPAHEHEFVLVSAEELTCTTNAVEYYECSCGATDFSIVERAMGHKWVIVSCISATCSDVKHEVMRCEICGEEKEITGAQTLNHRMETTVVAPTCTEEGYTAAVCLNCGYVAEKSDITPATGHQMKTTTVKPTCTANGYTADVCKVCGYTTNKTNPVEATGHTMKEKVIAPTCTTDGYTTNKCSVCGYEEGKTDIVPATGHTMADRTVEATCTTQGCDESYCTVCGYSAGKTNIVPALGHNYVDKVTEPTKTAGGYTEHTCSRCGDYVKDTFTDKLPDPIDIDELMAAGNAKIRAMGCKVDTSLTPNNSGYQMTSVFSYSQYGDRGTYVKSRVVGKVAYDMEQLFERIGEDDCKQYGKFRCYVEETSGGTGIEVYILYR